MATTSAGLLLYRYREGMIEVLLVHAGFVRPNGSWERDFRPCCGTTCRVPLEALVNWSNGGTFDAESPLHSASRRLDNLFDTHPPIADRIRRLESM